MNVAGEEDQRRDLPPEDQPGEPGAEGGSETARRSKAPMMPDEKDETPVGDTDQHSSG